MTHSLPIKRTNLSAAIPKVDRVKILASDSHTRRVDPHQMLRIMLDERISILLEVLLAGAFTDVDEVVLWLCHRAFEPIVRGGLDAGCVYAEGGELWNDLSLRFGLLLFHFPRVFVIRIVHLECLGCLGLDLFFTLSTVIFDHADNLARELRQLYVFGILNEVADESVAPLLAHDLDQSLLHIRCAVVLEADHDGRRRRVAVFFGISDFLVDSLAHDFDDSSEGYVRG